MILLQEMTNIFGLHSKKWIAISYIFNYLSWILCNIFGTKGDKTLWFFSESATGGGFWLYR